MDNCGFTTIIGLLSQLVISPLHHPTQVVADLVDVVVGDALLDLQEPFIAQRDRDVVPLLQDQITAESWYPERYGAPSPEQPQSAHHPARPGGWPEPRYGQTCTFPDCRTLLTSVSL